MIAYFIGFCVSVIIEDINYKKLLKESKRLTNEINNIN